MHTIAECNGLLLAKSDPLDYDSTGVILMNQIGKNIKKHRMEQGMTQDQLAEKLNVTRQAVSNWETGKTQPGVETLTAMAAHFGISVEELIYGKTRRLEISPDSNAGTGAIFGGLFLLFMLIWILFAGLILSNVWWLMITVSLILAGLVTVLIQQEDRMNTLTARIELLEKEL